jgi:hypothetical protein
MEIDTLIRTWAESKDLPLQGEATDAGQAVFLVLNGEKIPGEMTIAGKVSILRVREEPRSSYQVETCAGKMILDESWADAQSLPSILDYALQLLQPRLKSPQPVWALAFDDRKKWQDEEDSGTA